MTFRLKPQKEPSGKERGRVVTAGAKNCQCKGLEAGKRAIDPLKDGGWGEC